MIDTPSYFKDIHKYHQIIHETDLANNFAMYYKKYKAKLSKYMQTAIAKGNKYSAKEYAEAIDFKKRSYLQRSHPLNNYFRLDDIISFFDRSTKTLKLKNKEKI